MLMKVKDDELEVRFCATRKSNQREKVEKFKINMECRSCKQRS